MMDRREWMGRSAALISPSKASMPSPVFALLHLEDYARRKGVSLATVERWLGSALGYDAEAA